MKASLAAPVDLILHQQLQERMKSITFATLGRLTSTNVLSA